MAPEVAITEDILRESLFIRRRAEANMREQDGGPVAFALFLNNSYTFL